MHTIEAIVKDGQIVPVEDVSLEEGSRVLITVSEGNDRDFWMAATEDTLRAIWDNEEDDVYAELLTK
ncbi:MAG: antitoxin AF2212-like protein [Pyrinomonadaceae bacterium]